jgi:hypothetical protein
MPRGAATVVGSGFAAVVDVLCRKCPKLNVNTCSVDGAVFPLYIAAGDALSATLVSALAPLLDYPSEAVVVTTVCRNGPRGCSGGSATASSDRADEDNGLRLQRSPCRCRSCPCRCRLCPWCCGCVVTAPRSPRLPRRCRERPLERLRCARDSCGEGRRALRHHASERCVCCTSIVGPREV